MSFWLVQIEGAHWCMAQFEVVKSEPNQLTTRYANGNEVLSQVLLEFSNDLVSLWESRPNEVMKF